MQIDKIQPRDCLNAVRLANKINQIIDLLEENEVLTKSEYEKIMKKGEL